VRIFSSDLYVVSSAPQISRCRAPRDHRPGHSPGDCGDGNRVVVEIKKIQSFPECVAEVQGFYSAEEFLKCREMRNNGKIQNLLDRFHVFNIFNEVPVVLVPVVFEENQDKKLILGVDLFRIFTGIRSYTY